MPLFFLDYVAFGALEPAVVEGVVAGVARGLPRERLRAVGGETAEMPGVYTPPDYDLAGFIVGCVEEDAILGADARARRRRARRAREQRAAHQRLLARAADRLRAHAARRRTIRFRATTRTVADVLLRSTARIWRRCGRCSATIHAMAHITGGGLPGNLNRALPPTLDAVVDTTSWDDPEPVPAARAGGRCGRATRCSARSTWASGWS